KNTPMVAERMIQRPFVYNEVCDMIERLEDAGKAIVVYPEDMRINSREKDKIKLIQMYNQGESIAKKNVENWKDILL
ncbi:DUF6363 domain-containing protein, partial [Peptostreptococcus porci]